MPPITDAGFWNARAMTLGSQAGTQDRIAKMLEIRCLDRWATHVRARRVLDAGCGDGETLVTLRDYHALDEATGFDLSEAMLAMAERRCEMADSEGDEPVVQPCPRVLRHDLRDPLSPEWTQRFDLVYTERALINLPSWIQQEAAIRRLAETVRPGGALVLVECSSLGLATLNALRASVRLPEIDPPGHTCYLNDADVTALRLPNFLPWVIVEYYSDMYYFLSRVVNAAVSQGEGRSPAYDAPINRLAYDLDVAMMPHCGQGRAFVFERLP